MIAILDNRSILTPKIKKAKDVNIQDVDPQLSQTFDLILVHMEREFKVIKSHSFPLVKWNWNKEQIFRVIYHTLKQDDKQFDLRKAILELVKELDPRSITQLIREIEKEGFEKS
jgi:hypothetical protein